ncbi:MAG TPA: SDR family NAD(P)-dependent oxidoreductase, partial [Pseudomonadales bacterium]|nr:SDR family NAD(P)-dependent oxidoreductase [Pseudomonadales bacterium]
PAHLHFKQPNPHIGWSDMAVKVTAQAQAWPDSELPATAAVSSFGFTGTNAHVILQAHSPVAVSNSEETAGAQLLPLSAKTEAGLRAVVNQLQAHLAAHPNVSLNSLAYQLAMGKDMHRLRASLQVSTVEQLHEGLAQLADALAHDQLGQISRVKKQPKVVFFCSGQGQATAAALTELSKRFPVIRNALEQCQHASGLNLLDADGNWCNTDSPELARFCLEYALAQFYFALGLKPAALLGHGVGEFVCAALAEVFTLEEALQLLLCWSKDKTSYLNQLSQLKLKRAKLKLCASAERDPTKEGFWQALASGDVQFAERVEALNKLAPDIWLECGVADAASATNTRGEFQHLVSLRTDVAACESLLQVVSQLFLAGAEIQWRVLFATKPYAEFSLPTYPFQRSRHWNEVIELFQLNHQIPKAAQSWLYQIGWVPKSVWPEAASSARTLVLGSQHSLQQVTTICSEWQPNVAFAKLDTHLNSLQPADINAGLCRINPSCLDHFIALLNHFKPDSGQGLKLLFIVDPYFADSAAESSFDYVELSHLQRVLAESLLYLAQAMAYVGHVELTLVTVNGLSASADQRAPDPLQTLAAGFFQTMQVELAESAGVHIDVDALTPANIKQMLALHAREADKLGEQRVILRHGEAMVPRLRQTQPNQISNATRSLRKEQTYLIAGGMGSLGLALAEWLISKGARHLVLLSRSGEPQEASDPRVQRLAAMRAKGASVMAPALDITDADAMAALIKQIQQSNAPLAGVIHAAGVFDITPIKELSPEHFVKVLDNKVRGLWLLDELTKDIPLQLFVGFSSIASAWSAAGNAHYAAANAFVDGLIQKRRREGKAGLVVNWGPWADSGMVTDASSKLAEKRGLGMMPIELGLQVLGRLMNSDTTQQIVANVDVNKLNTVFSVVGKNALFSELANESAQPQTVELREEDLQVKQRLLEASEAQRPALLLAYLREQLARALQAEVESVDETQPLLNLGIDSLMAVEMRNRVRQIMAVDLPVTRLLEGANLMDLANWLCHAYAEQQNQGGTTPTDAGSAEEQEVEGVL